MKIVLATQNKGKLKELLEMADDKPWLELLLPHKQFDVEETGSTFLENAEIKAKAAALMTGLWAVADDSGLAVEALDGKPGIYSARYCEGTDLDRRNKLLQEMQSIESEKRKAAFICNMAVCDSRGEIVYKAEGIWLGKIGFAERGILGFGYDPVFYLLNRDITAAELSLAEKNLLSHRGQAWRQVLNYLERWQ